MSIWNHIHMFKVIRSLFSRLCSVSGCHLEDSPWSAFAPIPRPTVAHRQTWGRQLQSDSSCWHLSLASSATLSCIYLLFFVLREHDWSYGHCSLIGHHSIAPSHPPNWQSDGLGAVLPTTSHWDHQLLRQAQESAGHRWCWRVEL